MIRPIEEVLLPPHPIVDCEIHQRTGTIHGMCYQDADGKFWSNTFEPSVGIDIETFIRIRAENMARRHGLPIDGRVVRVRFVEVEG